MPPERWWRDELGDNPQEKGETMRTEDKTQLAEAFLEDAPCQITYRDQAGRWTDRTIRIEELHRDFVLAKCELRSNGYRRFNLGSIVAVAPITPPST